ncbi:hypothetical protein E4U48_006694 [Claviceps purpurea]|nr:hypothetical protein E4U48_006694 [Claviceps purpurea]
MYLFQATGITDQGSLANFAFGLINTETLEGFQWLCEQLNSLRLDVQAPAPKVVITDYEKALRKALNNVFPYTQQQLCVYHINTNVRSRIRSRWNKGKKNKENNSDEPARNVDDELEYWDSLGFSDDSDVSDDSDDSDESQSEGEPDLDIAGRTSTQEEAEEAFHHPPSTTNPQATENTWEGMFEAWKKVVYAAKEADFEQAWQYMKTTFGKDQLHTLRYIVKTYMPLRRQWAACFLSLYQNFGQRKDRQCRSSDATSHLRGKFPLDC